MISIASLHFAAPSSDALPKSSGIVVIYPFALRASQCRPNECCFLPAINERGECISLCQDGFPLEVTPPSPSLRGTTEPFIFPLLSSGRHRAEILQRVLDVQATAELQRLVSGDSSRAVLGRPGLQALRAEWRAVTGREWR